MIRLLLILTLSFFIRMVSVSGQTATVEIIETNSILINNAVPYLSNTKMLKEKFGKPDSIVQTSFECSGYFNVAKVKLWYYGKTVFETYRDTAVCREIYFTDGKFSLKTNQITLSKTTTLSDVINFFPRASEKAYNWLNPQDKKTYRIINIKPDNIADDNWMLYFYFGKLIKIRYLIPC